MAVEKDLSGSEDVDICFLKDRFKPQPTVYSVKRVVTIATTASFLIFTECTYIMIFIIDFYIWRNKETNGHNFNLSCCFVQI